MATNALPDQAPRQAEAELLQMMDDDASKGAVVHVFDPNVSPEEKAAEAAKTKDKLAPFIVSDGDTPAARELPVVTGSQGGLPTITVEDADRPEELEKAARLPPSLPGGYPDGPAPEVPSWYKVGWRAVAGIDAPPLSEQEKDKAVLQLFLTDQFYGDWYHNAGIIIFAVFASHFLTRFRFGWGWLFILLSICCTYYINSVSRVRRRARDDIQRELVKSRLASEHETAEWLNHFLNRFWLIYEPILSSSIVVTADQILSVSTPAFLDSLRLATFTLGTKAPRIDKVRTFPNTEDDVVMMDWSVSFTPSDLSDLTPYQAAKKVNPKIVLSVRVGRGIATAAMPILIEDLTFTGLMRVKLKLVSNFPHIQIVDLTFLERPHFDYVLKPVGGDTFGFDIGNIPGLSEFIREMVHATLGPMMYDPNVFSLNLEQLLSGAPLDAAIGVVKVTIDAARGIQGNKLAGGTPDPYVSITINNRRELARTKYMRDTFNPTWTESKFVLVNSLQDSLVLNVMDYNEHRKDTNIGAATFDLLKLQDDASIEGITQPIYKDGKDRGQLRFSLSYYPVLKPELVDGKEVLSNTNVGIVRMTIHQAKELDTSKSVTGGLNPFVKVYLGENKSAIHRTQIIKRSSNPVWESPIEFLCTDKRSTVINIKVVDDRDLLKDPVLGRMSVHLEDLMAAISEGRDWWPLDSCNSGKIRISLQWKPLEMAGALGGYVPPIGVVRLWLQRATDVKNVEAVTGGKSDPYVRVLVKNVVKGRTEVINNNLNPVWDEIIYIPVHSLTESMLMEVMDYQNLTKDRSLGSVELYVKDLARESSENPQYRHESTGRQETEDKIKLPSGDGEIYQGQLHYVAEFIPALALKNVHFDARANEIQQVVKAEGEQSARSPVEVNSGAMVQPSTENEVDKGPKPNTLIANGTTNGTAGPGETKAESENKVEDEKATPGLELSKEELLKHQSGIIIFNIVSGQLRKKARLEVLLDEGYWPAFSTLKARSTHAHWEHIDEAFVKEIDFGRVWLRLNESGDVDKEDIIAQWYGDVKPFLDSTLNRPSTFTLTNDDDKTSTIVIEARYVPVPVQLEPRESINNQGILRVDLIEGKDLQAADRGGKSDPYAVFTLDGQRVFKSETKKKTLNPEWSENFDVTVPSRVAGLFSVEVFDWNQFEQAKSLGVGNIRLDDLTAFEAAERTISLSSDKHGEKGYIRVRMLFRPLIIVKTRKNTSTFSAAGRAMTHIGTLPMEAGKGVLQGVGNIFRRETLNRLPSLSESPPSQSADPPLGSGAVHTSLSTESLRAPDGQRSQPGTLRVVVLGAKDLHAHDVKPYAVIRVGSKEHKTKHGHSKTSSPEWNETFVFAASIHTPKLFIWIYDHKTLGKDKVLGEGEVEIWSHVKSSESSAADVTMDLRDGGQVRLRLEYDADANQHVRGASVTSLDRSNPANSPSRFSLRGRRADPSDGHGD